MYWYELTSARYNEGCVCCEVRTEYSNICQLKFVLQSVIETII